MKVTTITCIEHFGVPCKPHENIHH